MAGILAPYCDCPICNEARIIGGKFRRSRSCFRLSDKMILDLGADAVTQSAVYGSLSDIEHILITHTHDDHFNLHMLMENVWVKTKKLPRNYYFTDKAYSIVEHWRHSGWILKGRVSELEREGLVRFHKLQYGVSYRIDDVEVIPFKGVHVGNVKENSAMYLITLQQDLSHAYKSFNFT